MVKKYKSLASVVWKYGQWMIYEENIETKLNNLRLQVYCMVKENNYEKYYVNCHYW